MNNRLEASRDHRGLLWVALGASLWGTDTVLRRPLTAALSSAQIVLLEHVVLAAVLLPIVWRTRAQWQKLGGLEWAAVLGISWGGSALGTVLFTEAVKSGNPTVAVLLQKMQPLVAALLAGALLGETLGRRFWASLAVALGAAYLVSFGAGAPLRGGGVRLAAAAFALGAAALWGASTVLGRFVLARVSFSTLTALRITVALPPLAGLAWLRGELALPALDYRQGASLLILALVPGLAALLVYYRGLGRARASRAAIAELAFPATATLLNWTILGARLTALQLAGFALLWAVILNLETGRDKSRQPAGVL